ncbi:hypothetical protein KJ765_03740 [Candidatus Micrarchaeota archaeon]|nr:hypothetical protein [Candidatus Micrarchaeota archaeon]
MHKKGFIGPIGDDIPSLFPIIAGIFIFLISIGFIQSQINARNEYIDLRDDVLQVSYVATEKGYMSRVPDLASDFDLKCSLVKEIALKRQLNFTMILKPFCGPVNVNQFFAVNPALGSYPARVCSSFTRHEDMDSVGSGDIEFGDENTVIMSFPMATDCGDGKRGLAFISVAGWR